VLQNRAGVIGLDVALILAENGYGHRTTVVAQHLPGDTSVDYTSPWYVADLRDACRDLDPILTLAKGLEQTSQPYLEATKTH
jgi:hypothetical protein